LIALIPLLSYIGILIFILGCAKKGYKYWNTPIHLRWEIYPIAHEKGGSYFEELDWWNNKRNRSLMGEIITMSEEIFLLKGVRDHNKNVWIFSYPFHIGLYLLTAFVGFIVLAAIARLINLPVQIFDIINSIIVLTGVFGSLLTIVGSIGLLFKRIFDDNLKRYSTAQDYFNLIFILVIALIGFWAWLTTDNYFKVLGDYVYGLMTLSPVDSIRNSSPWVIDGIVLFSLFLIYFPFTHMTHPIGKYFLYHQVRWNDEPNVKGSKLVKKIEKVLNYKVSWSAIHIKGEGKKTWADLATKEVDTDDKEN
jgi:nitrate reductase gamma subunit